MRSSQETAQDEDKWATVRIAAALIPPLEELIENVKDEFGMQLFRNKSDAVTKAVKEFLMKYSSKTKEE